jgi:hypothetical protein
MIKVLHCILVIVLLVVPFSGAFQPGIAPLIPPAAVFNIFRFQKANTVSSLAVETASVQLHPNRPLQVGDQVSVDVFLSPPTQIKRTLHAQVMFPITKDLGSVNFDNIDAGQQRASLRWAWDTRSLSPGIYVLNLTVQPDHVTFQESIRLDAPDGKHQAWAMVRTDCCEIHYITGTNVEMDLPKLIPMINMQAADVLHRMNARLDHPIVINLVPRIVGNGGFTTDEITVSDPSLNYSAILLDIVIHHEMVHFVDATLGGEYRPTMLVEGLAVNLSGGHFKKEPVVERAAALRKLNWYIPLHELADNFYPSQHEVGYTEASALISYMVQTYGQGAFDSFYRSMHPAQDKKDSTVIDTALRKNFNISLDDLEKGFTAFLDQQTVTNPVQRDLELTVRYYDTVRAYQKRLDPTAYFRTVWLPSPKEMRSKAIVGDYLETQAPPQNLEILHLLSQAGKDLQDGQYSNANTELNSVDGLLPLLPQPGIINRLKIPLPTYAQ